MEEHRRPQHTQMVQYITGVSVSMIGSVDSAMSLMCATMGARKCRKGTALATASVSQDL